MQVRQFIRRLCGIGRCASCRPGNLAFMVELRVLVGLTCKRHERHRAEREEERKCVHRQRGSLGIEGKRGEEKWAQWRGASLYLGTGCDMPPCAAVA